MRRCIGARPARLGVAVLDQRLADQHRAGALARRTASRRPGRGPRTRRPGPRSSGISGASRAKVSRSTSRVLRLRALTPISSAPASTARGGLVLVVHLDQRRSGRARGPGRAGGAAWSSSSAATISSARSAPAARASQHLVGLTMKSLRSTGHVDRGADRAQVVEAAAEPALLGEHADRGGPAGGVAAGPARPGRRSSASVALAGAGPLHLGDHARAGRAQRGHRVARRVDVGERPRAGRPRWSRPGAGRGRSGRPRRCRQICTDMRSSPFVWS